MRRNPDRLVNPPPTSDATRHVMQANRARDTGPERLLRRTLWSAGIRGYRLHWRTVPGRPDISFPGRKLAIFVHGCFWHHCPHCQPPLPKSHSEFWRRKFELNRARDQRKERQLVQAGWTVLTFWECEIHSTACACVDQIRSALERGEKEL